MRMPADSPRHAQRWVEFGEDDARDRIRIEAPRLAIELCRLLEPSLERERMEAGTASDDGLGRRLRAPRRRAPLAVEDAVFGALELIAAGLCLVGGLDHHSADARLQRTSHALCIDEMLGRARDQRVLQGHAPKRRREHVHGRQPALRRAWRVWP